MDLSRLKTYEAIIFDLDGTLVTLATDWKKAHSVADEVLVRSFPGSINNLSIWEKVELARREGIEGVEEAIAALEIEGAKNSQVLPLGRAIGQLQGPLGICTMNCLRSVEESLGRLKATDKVGAIIAREQSTALKPDPQSLRACVDLIGLEVDKIVYVGDMRRDEEAAERLGMDFVPAQEFNGGSFPFEPKG